MPLFNAHSQEVHFKIVYYGPAFAGKTTNIQYIYHKTAPTQKGKLLSTASPEARLLFFEFSPQSIAPIDGFRVKFQFYTVPGTAFGVQDRKRLIDNLDGLIYVADSAVHKREENVRIYTELVLNLLAQETDYTQLPLVFQFNKRDLEETSSIEQLKQDLNTKSCPVFEAVATNGDGVFDTVKSLTKLVLTKTRTSPSKAGFISK